MTYAKDNGLDNALNNAHEFIPRRKQPLTKSNAHPDPFVQFEQWFAQAVAADLYQPHGMILATATPEGKPSVRTVLMKGFDERGFVFFTHHESRKSQELAANAWAAILFWWREIHRQVRIEGMVGRIAAAESDTYFATRPRGSQIGAWASPQSEIIADWSWLEQRYVETAVHYAPDQPVPRPPHWGGFRLVPTVFEFWQGQENRLHDRLQYGRLPDDTWSIERLAP